MYGQSPAYDAWVAKVIALRDQLRRATGEARLDLGTTLLNAIGNAAVNAPNDVLRTRWMQAYGALRPDVAALRASYAPSPPPAWLRALDVFSDKVLKVADDVASGVAATAKALPVLLPIVALGLGALLLGRRRRG